MLNTFQNAEKQHLRRMERERHLQMMDNAVNSPVDVDGDEEETGAAVNEFAGGSVVVGHAGEGDYKNSRYSSRRLRNKITVLLAAAVVLVVVLTVTSVLSSGNNDGGSSPTFDDGDGNPNNKNPTSEQQKKYDTLFSMILDWNVTPRAVLQEQSSAANQALRWLAYEDQMDSLANPEALRGRYALATLFFSNKASWVRDKHWMSSYSVCFWHGIACVNDDETVGLVQAVNLTANGLMGGVLPPEIALLQHDLESLDISGNAIQGTIPDLSPLINLKYLYLGANDISGSIPASVFTLSHLTHLYLGDCKLSGSLPDALGELSNLQGLSMHNNFLTDAIPPSIGELTDLRVLYLDSNSFTATIPTQIGYLTRLVDLRLNSNHLRGSIPTEISNMRILQDLYLDSNALTGEIPGASLANLHILRQIHLHDNKLIGPIPDELGSLLLLDVVYLDQNLLTGGIASSLSKLNYLDSLYLGFNDLTGGLPSELGGLSNLKHLRLENNMLSGPIPSQLGQLARVETLFLNNNTFYGPLPSQLPGALKNLRYARFHGNRLTGMVHCASAPKHLFELTGDCFSEDLSCECCTDCYY